MAGINCRHCLNICKITCEMTKHLSTCKVKQGMAHRKFLRNILFKKNNFLIAKTEAMLLLIEPIKKKKYLYTNALNKRDPALDKRDPAAINEAAELPGKSKNTKMLNVRQILPENKYTNSSRSRSEIQSI